MSTTGLNSPRQGLVRPHDKGLSQYDTWPQNWLLEIAVSWSLQLKSACRGTFHESKKCLQNRQDISKSWHGRAWGAGESRRQKMEGEGVGGPSAQVSQGGACSLTGDEKMGWHSLRLI